MDGYERFLRDPAAAWRERLHPSEPWLRGLVETLRAAKPAAGHRALAALEELGFLSALITQNIDDLHRQAGSQRVLEIHGNHRLLRCIGCQERFAPDAIEVCPERLPPRCPHCGDIVKGDTVQFGEPIPPDVLRDCGDAARAADCMLVVGTSATVFPAAEFPLEVLRRGGRVIEVNPEESDLTRLATRFLRGPAGPVLSRLLHHVTHGPAPRAHH
jgi:NAD-dependent deacetylase